MTQFVILGSGIIGLWTAHILTEMGRSVRIISDQDIASNTSAVAASVLTPFLPWDPSSKMFRDQVSWAKETLRYIQGLEIAPEATHLIDCFEFGHDDLLEDSFHVSQLDYLDFTKFHRIDLDEKVYGLDFAIAYRCMFCDPKVLMPWLLSRALQNGAVFEKRKIASQDDLRNLRCDAIFNCLGHNHIFADYEAYPVFGQSMFVPSSNNAPPYFGIGAGENAIFRHPRGFYLGSYFIKNSDRSIPDPAIYQDSIDFLENKFPILCKISGYVPPKIDPSQIETVQTGIRPFRNSGTDISAEMIDRQLVIHNRGHGAHGWTIGYATARRAVNLALAHLSPSMASATQSTIDFIGRIEASQREVDLQQCAELMLQSDPWKVLGFSLQDCQEALHNPEVIVHVVRENQGDASIIGFLAAMKYGVESEPLAEFLCVRQDFRGKGLGTALMAYFEDVLFPDAANLYLFVSDINPRAKSLYERLGYKGVGKLPDYNLYGQTEFFLRKNRRPKLL